MATVKAHIYAANGDLLGYIAYAAVPPNVLDLDGRFFEKRDETRQIIGSEVIHVFNYWEIDVDEEQLTVIYICIGCGRNASLVWHKCCPDHLTIEGPEVYCQSCVERLHPGDPDFARE